MKARGWCIKHYKRWWKGGDPGVKSRKEKSARERFAEKVCIDIESGCWLWTSTLNHSGYGQFWDGSRQVYAHRYSYEFTVGTIPEGLHLDHLCRTPACVNPSHLEPVTPLENTHRAMPYWAPRPRRTHCPQGHAYEGENVRMEDGKQRCRECVRRRARDRYWRLRARSTDRNELAL